MPLILSLLVLSSLAWSAVQPQVWTEPERAAREDPDFLVQGEYVADATTGAALEVYAVQVVAGGAGTFDAYVLKGGLPGAGFVGKRVGRMLVSDRYAMKGTRTAEGAVAFRGERFEASVKSGVMTLKVTAGGEAQTLRRIERVSSTMGATPPPKAVVLFDGTKQSLDQWRDGKMSEDGLLMPGTTSKQTFLSHRLHLEFRTPYKPQARGQRRGNSGLYVQGRFEAQILDSFGLTGENNEAGGIYSIADCPVNACFPPLRWQTYDIDFVAAVFDGDRKIESARVTVRLNGILVHENQELAHATTSSPLADAQGPGPVYLQDHENPVRFRNIWVVPR